MTHKVIHGDSAQELKKLADNSIDAVVTDPPYGIEFLAKEWDSNTGAVEIWSECFRVLKPGGYLLAFSAARTYHHLATNIESVGFEIRDQIMWLYASGFPKAQDIGKAIDKRQGKKDPNFKGTETFNLTFGENPGQRLCAVCKKDQTAVYQCDRVDCGQKYSAQTPQGQQWHGWKTALKPAHEPICMARKPFKGSTIDNVLTHGVGALNIDATRIDWDEKALANIQRQNELGGEIVGGGIEKYATVGEDADSKHETQRILLNQQGRFPSNVLGEVEGYQKFFYCPKVSRAERHRGFEQDHIPDPLANYSQGDFKNHPLWDSSIGTNIQRLKHKILEHEKTLGNEHRVAGNVGNNHPTVKPVELMKYLIRLVTPQGAHVLDPFCGSGSTGMACKELGNTFTGIEQDKNYVSTAQQRIDATVTDPKHTLFE